ncbi:MAG: polymer-forming cytoskeletal protein [Ignavibacteria bacterium]|nr:polymer-forming cytoskeletal protein [Ignavibacteria bacterium]
MKFKKERDAALEDVSIISEVMEIRGDIVTLGSIRLDGKVYGNIKSGGNVTIGNLGEVHGDIHAKSIANGGIVAGSVFMEEKITLESKSSLKGDLHGKILVIEEGAVFIGKSEMKQPEPVAAPDAQAE